MLFHNWFQFQTDVDLLSSARFDFALRRAGTALGHKGQLLFAENGLIRMRRRRRTVAEAVASAVAASRRLQHARHHPTEPVDKWSQQLEVISSGNAQYEKEEPANGHLSALNWLYRLPSSMEIKFDVLDNFARDEGGFLSVVIVAVPAQRRIKLKKVTFAVQGQVRDDDERGGVHLDALNCYVRLIFAVHVQAEGLQVILLEGLNGDHDVGPVDGFDADESQISDVARCRLDALARR